MASKAATHITTIVMSQNLCQLNVHFVFAVKGRESLIEEAYRIPVEKYITAVIQRRKHRVWAIYCMPDHLHILVGKRPHQSESDLVRDIKSNSSSFINSQGWLEGRFAWQRGFAAFSCSDSHLKRAIPYILNQAAHHQMQKFRQEFEGMLQLAGLEADPKDMFEWIDD
jgi:REP element-mobilizing transposase RayT